MRVEVGERGVTIVDVLVVLAVVALLVFAATREFPRYDERAAPAPTASAK